jgi:hypothetical protein
MSDSNGVIVLEAFDGGPLTIPDEPVPAGGMGDE